MATTTYEHTTTTVSGPAPSSGDSIRPDPLYIRTIPGILKIVEIFLDLLVLICASIDHWTSLGGGWVQFVAATAMVTTTILFVFHFFNIISRLPGPWVLIEFIYYVAFVVMFFIAAIVTAVRAHLAPSIGAACFFTFIALAIYAVDCFFMFRTFRTVQHPNTSGQPAPNVTTTTTTTTYETRTQY